MPWRDWFQGEWHDAGCTMWLLYLLFIVVVFGGLILAAALVGTK